MVAAVEEEVYTNLLIVGIVAAVLMMSRPYLMVGVMTLFGSGPNETSEAARAV